MSINVISLYEFIKPIVVSIKNLLVGVLIDRKDNEICLLYQKVGWE